MDTKLKTILDSKHYMLLEDYLKNNEVSIKDIDTVLRVLLSDFEGELAKKIFFNYKDKLEEERKQNKLQLAMIDRNISNTLNLVNSLVVASNLKYCVDISDERSEIYRKSQDMIKKKIEKRKQHKDNYKG